MTELACQSCGCSYTPTSRREGARCGDLSNVFHIACVGIVTIVDAGHAQALRVASTARDHVGRALAQVAGATPEMIDKLSSETLAALTRR